MREKLNGFYIVEADSKLEAKKELYNMFILTMDTESLEDKMYSYLGNFDVEVREVFMRNNNEYDVHFTVKSYLYDSYTENMIDDLEKIMMTGLSVF